jgi:hypothetical protein
MRMPAHLSQSPWARTHSSYQGPSARANVTRPHRSLCHADDGNVEQFPRGEKTGIAESRDDRGINVPVTFREHFERDGAADLRFGTR